MKSLIALFVFALAALPNAAFAGGIDFFHGSWDDAVKKAKAEQKLIFVDAYATWCGPCKWMAREAFPDGDVGAFFNANFISFKMDMERGEGPGFGKKYPVQAYPTLMFIDGNAKMFHQTSGAHGADDLLKLGKAVFKKYGKTPINNGGNNNNNNNVIINNSDDLDVAESYLVEGAEAVFKHLEGDQWVIEENGEVTATLEDDGQEDGYLFLYNEEESIVIKIPIDGGVIYGGLDDSDEWIEMGSVTRGQKGNNNNNNGGKIKGSIGGGGKTTGKVVMKFSSGSFETSGGDAWIERNSSGETIYRFKVQDEDEEYIYILDDSRGVYIAIPQVSGMSYVMRDEVWSPLYELTKK